MKKKNSTYNDPIMESYHHSLLDPASNGYKGISSRNTFIFNKWNGFPCSYSQWHIHFKFIGVISFHANCSIMRASQFQERKLPIACEILGVIKRFDCYFRSLRN
uniref:Uncharacterized protein n=1 Tax=Rhizophora mucronata TaxID=61149 RepID=A0A2P2JMX4_RHIMU